MSEKLSQIISFLEANKKTAASTRQINALLLGPLSEHLEAKGGPSPVEKSARKRSDPHMQFLARQCFDIPEDLPVRVENALAQRSAATSIRLEFVVVGEAVDSDAETVPAHLVWGFRLTGGADRQDAEAGAYRWMLSEVPNGEKRLSLLDVRKIPGARGKSWTRHQLGREVFITALTTEFSDMDDLLETAARDLFDLYKVLAN